MGPETRLLPIIFLLALAVSAIMPTNASATDFSAIKGLNTKASGTVRNMCLRAVYRPVGHMAQSQIPPSFYHQVGIIGKKDERDTFRGFMGKSWHNIKKRVKYGNTFAASGSIQCTGTSSTGSNTKWGSGSLVEGSATVASAGHVFHWCYSDINEKWKRKLRRKYGSDENAEKQFEDGAEAGYRMEFYNRDGKKRKKPNACKFTTQYYYPNGKMIEVSRSIDPYQYHGSSNNLTNGKTKKIRVVIPIIMIGL